FQGIKEKYPEQPHGYERAAKLTHFLLDWELALERWNQAIAKFPHNIAYQVEKGNVLINLSRFDEAEAVFQGVKQRFPEQPHGYDGYARVAHSWVDLELALERWSEAIAKFPDRINFQIYKGNVLIKLFRFDEADVVFQGIKQRFPEQPHGYDGYARVAHSWGDLELALERWEEAIAKLPNHFQFYLCKGDALINLFRYEEAETWFEEVVAKYPHRHEGLFQSASLARRLGNLELAKQKWELAIQHLPEQIPAYCEAARDLKALGRFAEAEEKFRQALQKSPNDLTALLQGGILASQQENRELALERFERIIEYHPPQKSIDAYILAATELKYLGRQDEAIAKYEQVLNFNRSPHLHLEVKLLGTSLTCIQELGLLLDRLVTKPPDSIKHIIYLARLTKQILCSGISRKPYSIGFVAQDAPSLLPKLKLLKKLFWQVLATQEDCKKWNLGIADFGYDLYLLAIAQLLNEKYLRLFSFYFHTLIQQWQQDLLVLKHLNIAIQLLEKESQRLNSSECERVKQVPSPIAPQLIDNLCFEDLSSSARYIIGRDELLESSKRKAATTFSPLMDEEKVFFEVPIRNFVSSLKLRSRQDIFIYKDVVWNAPFAFSQGYIIPHYGLKISDKFVNEFVDDNPSSAKEHVAKYDTFKYIIDPRPTLKEIPVSKKVLNTYYEDDVVFGLPVVGYIWGAYQNYGHLLLDQIPSLILYQKLNLSCKIFVPHITDSHWDILNALNIPKEQILVKPEHKFKHLIISVYRYEIEMLEFYRRLRCSIAANSSDKFPEYCLRKIYVSRRYSSYRHMANEIEVEELMKSLGFSIIYLERLSFEETALLMHHVSLVVAPFGASLGSFILCRARTTLVIIFPPDAYLLPDVYKILVLGEYQFYPLSGDKTVNGWQINTDKLEKVVTKLVEGQVKN
ncbi:tetratricopeptide repeat protein, partial [Dapis sp. BLCC M126]|uniref:tetratricopeptide repeat protein n=1 Tax=Dapis sp. BLCC M126 TaxID=3400189 RepID=UPI003CEF1416